MDQIRETPHRSPLVVAEALKDVLTGKIVCDLGCAEGDNMMSLARYAKHVVGLENDRKRYQLAYDRKLDVTLGDYWFDKVPAADVYYLWALDGSADNEYLVSKLLDDGNFNGTIVIAADSSIPSELVSVRRCARLGELRAVPYEEGYKERQCGIMLLAIIDAVTARKKRISQHSTERRMVVTMAVGRNMSELMEVTFPGIGAYADKTGADCSLISQPRIFGPSPFYEIFQTNRLFDFYDRILYIDLDVIVRADAPDLFDIVPVNHLGVFMESRAQPRYNEIVGIQKTWPPLTWDSDYFNNGVTLMSKEHKYIMQPPKEYPTEINFDDQTVMNYRAIESSTPIYDISENFNYIPCVMGAGNNSQRFSAWMIHYAGGKLPKKVNSARQDLALWTDRQYNFPKQNKSSISRVFLGLVPAIPPEIHLEIIDNSGQLVDRKGRVLGELNMTAATIWAWCDGNLHVSDIILQISDFYYLKGQEVENEIIVTIDKLLDLELLTTTNQYAPLVPES